MAGPVPLKRVLGHSKIDTTQRYWRAMEQNRLREKARDIIRETPYESNREEATSGFEPLYEALQASA